MYKNCMLQTNISINSVLLNFLIIRNPEKKKFFHKKKMFFEHQISILK